MVGVYCHRMDGGWSDSAEAWIAHLERGDRLREHILDPILFDWIAARPFERGIDIGCGEGRLVRRLGSKCVGVDPTARLIEEARRKDPGGGYVVAPAEQIPFPDGHFDLVLSCLVLLDIADLGPAMAEMRRVTSPGGRVLFASLSPYSTACSGDFTKSPKGYTAEACDRLQWSGIDIVNYHRPLEAYMNAFLSEGFRLTRFAEPTPSVESMRANPSLLEFVKVPLAVVMEWTLP